MAWRTERHQAVEVEVRAPLGALDDVVERVAAPPSPASISSASRLALRILEAYHAGRGLMGDHRRKGIQGGVRG
jgi:hypothetical protein